MPRKRLACARASGTSISSCRWVPAVSYRPRSNSAIAKFLRAGTKPGSIRRARSKNGTASPGSSLMQRMAPIMLSVTKSSGLLVIATSKCLRASSTRPARKCSNPGAASAARTSRDPARIAANNRKATRRYRTDLQSLCPDRAVGGYRPVAPRRRPPGLRRPRSLTMRSRVYQRRKELPQVP